MFSADVLPLCYHQTVHILNRDPITLVFEDYSNPSAYDDLIFDDSYPVDSIFEGVLTGWNVDEFMFPSDWEVHNYCDPCLFLRGYAIIDVTPSAKPFIVFPVCYNFFGNVICTSIYNSITQKYDKILVDIYAKNLRMDYYYTGGYVGGAGWRTYNPKSTLSLFIYTAGVEPGIYDTLRVYDSNSRISLSDAAKTAKVTNSFDLRWGWYGNTFLGTAGAGSYNTSVCGESDPSYSIPIPGDGSKRPIVLPIAQKKFGPTATDQVMDGYNYTIFNWMGFEIAATERATGVYWGVFETVANNGIFSQLRILGAEAISFPYLRKWANPRYAWELFYFPYDEPYCSFINDENWTDDIAKAFILST